MQALDVKSKPALIKQARALSAEVDGFIAFSHAHASTSLLSAYKATHDQHNKTYLGQAGAIVRKLLNQLCTKALIPTTQACSFS